MFFLKNEKYKDVADLLYTAGTIGLQLVSATFVGLGMGWLADKYIEKWFGVSTKPWGLLLMLLMGIVAGFMNVFEDAKRIQQRTSGKDHPGAGQEKSQIRGEDDAGGGKSQ